MDTVKQAEVFAAVRTHYDLERDDNLQLRDFPTLRHVADWVRGTRRSRHAGTRRRRLPAPVRLRLRLRLRPSLVWMMCLLR